MAYDQLMQTYLGVGLLGNRPAAPNVAPGVAAFYYGTDTATLYVWNAGIWHTLAGTGGSLVTQSSYLGADVPLDDANYHDGPSLTLAAGTWLVHGTATLLGRSAGNDYFPCKIWDGAATTYASGEGSAAGGSGPCCVTLVAQATLAVSTTLTLSAASAFGTGGAAIKAAMPHLAAGNTATRLVALKVS